MRITLQPAFILHQRPYRETSVLLDVLTQDYGRVGLVARGVRQQRSKLKSLLQPFNPLFISWQGRGELMNLVSVESAGPPYFLRKDCLLSGFYLHELLIRLLHKYDPHPRLYTVYQRTLVELSTGNLLESTLRLFEKKLLEEIGYGLQLEHNAINGQAILTDQNYEFQAEQGFKVADNNSIERWIFSGKSLLALASETLDDPECLKDAKRLMRIVLTPLLGSQPLHSRKLFFEVEA